jgi:hypothetical protein
MRATISLEDLCRFTAIENLHSHSLLPKIRYTDGAKFLADRTGAYWLLDAIALGQRFDKIAAVPFQQWRLMVDIETKTAVLACENENRLAIMRRAIPYTDFPLAEVTLYFVRNTISLPSEY